MMDRLKMADERGWTVREIYRAKDAWRKLYVRQPSSTLSFEEYLDMMSEAGLRPDMVGLRRGQHHLARYGDVGPYTRTNCRFIPQEQNQAERVEGYQKRPAFRQLMSKIAKERVRLNCACCGGAFTAGMFSRWHGSNCKHKLEVV